MAVSLLGRSSRASLRLRESDLVFAIARSLVMAEKAAPATRAGVSVRPSFV
jgi:hypothetical protein